jgi:hypothetical protein
MPAMEFFERASNYGFITESSLRPNLNRVDVHAVFRQRFRNAPLKGVPEESPGTDEYHFSICREGATKFNKPFFDLTRVFKFTPWHVRLRVI